MRLIDLTGKIFGRLTVVARSTTLRSGLRMWDCVCVCGAALPVRGQMLRESHTQSCGCYHRDLLAASSTRHGHAKRGAKSPTYTAWCGMWARLTNEKDKSFPDYGGRGIRAALEWREFNRFLADMGEAPAGLTLERLDVDADYRPGNCVWETRIIQANNRQSTRRFVFEGRAYTRAELGRLWDLNHHFTCKKIRLFSLPELPRKIK